MIPVMRDESSGPVPSDSPDATVLVRRVQEGDRAAADELLPLVYRELRARAGAYFRGQPGDHTLQPTALVHEAYVKLVHAPSDEWTGRAHFCSVAALAMRQILTDHARRRASAPPMAGQEDEKHPTLMDTPSGASAVDLIALDEAISKLAALDERHARVVELRFFGGLTNDQVADVLGVSRPTVERDWRRIRAWLNRELEGGSGG